MFFAPSTENPALLSSDNGEALQFPIEFPEITATAATELESVVLFEPTQESPHELSDHSSIHHRRDSARFSLPGDKSVFWAKPNRTHIILRQTMARLRLPQRQSPKTHLTPPISLGPLSSRKLHSSCRLNKRKSPSPMLPRGVLRPHCQRTARPLPQNQSA